MTILQSKVNNSLILLLLFTSSLIASEPGKSFHPMPWSGMTSANTDAGTLKWWPGQSVDVPLGRLSRDRWLN